MRQSPTDIVSYSSKDLTLADVMREIGGLKQDVHDLKTVITGNGAPMDGLSVRVTLLERWRAEISPRTVYHIGATIINFLALAGLLLWMVFNVR